MDGNTAAVIVGAFGCISSMTSAFFAYLAASHGKENKETLKEVKEQTNGRMTELVASKVEAATLKGKQEEHDRLCPPISAVIQTLVKEEPK